MQGCKKGCINGSADEDGRLNECETIMGLHVMGPWVKYDSGRGEPTNRRNHCANESRRNYPKMIWTDVTRQVSCDPAQNDTSREY